MPRIKVNLKDRSYPVVIGVGMTESLPALVANLPGVTRIFLIYDANFFALHGATVLKNAKQSGCRIEQFTLLVNERSKSRATLNKVTDYLLSENITRSDLIVACGGGIISDLVGFAAASTLRGIRWGVISSTLLGMVDAAIGGKTAVNHGHGKNLIGAFWQPSFVICDLDHLQTLPERQVVAGMGEIVKYAGLSGEPMITDCNRFLSSTSRDTEAILARLVAQSVRYKADIVAKDEREGKLRMVLNLGHTFGHAIEQSLNFKGLLHGEAVMIGLLGALELSRLVNAKSVEKLNEYYTLVKNYVALVPQRKLVSKEIVQAMRADKKRSTSGNRFILLDRPGKPNIIEDVPRPIVVKSVNRMLVDYRIQGV